MLSRRLLTLLVLMYVARHIDGLLLTRKFFYIEFLKLKTTVQQSDLNTPELDKMRKQLTTQLTAGDATDRSRATEIKLAVAVDDVIGYMRRHFVGDQPRTGAAPLLFAETVWVVAAGEAVDALSYHVNVTRDVATATSPIRELKVVSSGVFRTDFLRRLFKAEEESPCDSCEMPPVALWMRLGNLTFHITQNLPLKISQTGFNSAMGVARRRFKEQGLSQM